MLSGSTQHIETSVDPIGSIDRAMQTIAVASADALEAVAICDERRLWQRDGATSMTPWLAARYEMAWGTAREWVRIARALRNLPAIAAAYRSGGLSWDQLRPLTRFACAETDALWTARAPSMSPAGLYREARRHERIRLPDAEDIYRGRSLSMWWDDELPICYLEGTLPSEQGSTVQAALTRRAEEIVLADQPDDPGGAGLADALVELVACGEGGGSPGTSLIVHADAQVLVAEEPDVGPSLAETELGQRSTSEAVRRLACDAQIGWVLELDGRPVGVGRRGRAVPGFLGRILRFRDVSCRFPGCERRRWLKVHHNVHWADGGATDLDNLVLLCHAHHRLIHEGGWKISGHPGLDLRFHDPGGRALRSVRVSRGP